MSRGQRVGSNPHLPHLPPPNPTLTQGPLWLIHLFPSFYRHKQKNTSGMGGTRGGVGGLTGCCFVFRILFSFLFPRRNPNAGAQAAPNSPLLHLPHLHARLPSAKPRPHTPRPLFGGSSAPHRASYCCWSIVSLGRLRRTDGIRGFHEEVWSLV